MGSRGNRPSAEDWPEGSGDWRQSRVHKGVTREGCRQASEDSEMGSENCVQTTCPEISHSRLGGM